MSLDLSQVDAVLAGQEAAVIERVNRTGLDTEQVAEIRRVRNLLPTLAGKLGDPEFVASLANPDSKRATFIVRWPSGTEAVLKLAGCIERGESDVLLAWQRAGVPAVRVINAGEIAGCSYIVTEYREAPTMKRVLEERLIGQANAMSAGIPAGPDPLRSTVTEMVTALRRAHLPVLSSEWLRPLSDRLAAPLRVDVGRLHELGIAIPGGFTAAVLALDEGPQVLLHGDPWVGNLLYDGGPVLIDPAACYGPAEYDAAQAIAQITPPARIQEMVRLAASIDPSLDPGRVRRHIGVFHTMEAGRRSAGLSHMAESTKNPVAASPYRDARSLLNTAAVMLRAPLRRGAEIAVGAGVGC